MKDLKKEYDDIVITIKELQNRKLELEKLIIDLSGSFTEKFRYWYLSDEECHHDGIVQSPILSALFDKNDEKRRGQTYDLYDLINDDLDYVIYPDLTRKYFDSEEEFNERLTKFLEEYQPALQEAMDTNMKSFKADW